MGSIPKDIEGTLYRNGAGKLKVFFLGFNC